MPAVWNPEANALFLQVLEQPPTAREAFLQQACGANAELAEQVRSLLAASEQAGGFLESPPTVVTNLADTAREMEVESPRLEFLSPSERPDALGRLGHYEVLAVVGSGGFGTVLKAFDSQLHRIVAIKALHPSLAASATARKRFVREARAAAAINHENVVDIYAVDESGPVPYLVMEYVGGVALDERLKTSGSPELKEILRIGMQIAAGLAAAHKQGLVHRDVKPANILLENGVERVKITDFGLARTVDDVSLTQTGLIAGTPQYMSPEQARGEPVDHRSDLFSLGSVLYAMCAGRVPFRGETSLAVLRKVCDESPHPLRDLNPDIPDWLANIVARLHAKEPAGRYQSAAEVSELLGQCLANLQQSARPEPVVRADPKPTRQVERNWRPLAIAAGALVVLLAIFSLAEGTGVTQVAATIVRIFTPAGTLIVETDDPGVKVTVEGDGGLIITGTGLEEIRLRPGSYRVQADKNGQPLPLERELISITQGDRKVVRVKLKPADTLLTPTAEGFVALFNGKDLTGWAAAGGGAGMWKIEDGALTCTGRRDHLLTTRNDFSDFHLRAEVKINAHGNSGIYFRTGKPLVLVGDYEAQITDNPGQQYKTGSLYGLVRITESPVPPDTWFTLEIIAVGSRIRVLVNGQETADYTENRAGRNTKGHIALQHHDPESRVFFRKVEVKEFPLSKSAAESTPARSSLEGAPPSAVAPFDAATAKEHQEAWAKHLGVPVEFTNSVGMKLRLIPPGEFEMGSTPQAIEAARAAEKYSDDQAMSDALASEGPIHRVILSEPFYLGITEVTQKEFETVTGQNPSSFRAGGANADKVGDADTSRLPVEGLSWNDAADFCSQLSLREGLTSNYRPVGTAVQMLPGNGYRLPREAQWEFACRAGTMTQFWFGDRATDHANQEWLRANSEGRPHTVGSLAKNPFGLFDMHGNVSEWCQDGWNPEFYLMCKERPAVDPLSKPQGPHQHMVRGGAWTSEPAVRGRSAFRMPGVPSKRYESNGFRVVLAIDSARQVIEGLRQVTPPSARGAFVILNVKGVEMRKFDTLAEAVQSASDGDTIEIRGNGPFISEPVNMLRRALTIRAGAGFRPVIKLSPEASQRDVPLLATSAALVLEGLDLHRLPPEDPANGRYAFIKIHQAPLRAANCRFSAGIYPIESPVCVFRNCEFVAAGGVSGEPRSAARIVFENCLRHPKTFPLVLVYDDVTLRDISIVINRSTFLGDNTPLWLALKYPLPVPSDSPQASKPFRFDVAESIFDAAMVLGFDQRPESLEKSAVLPPADAEAALLRLLQWRGERNLFAIRSSSMRWIAEGKQQPPHGPKNLEEWKQFWGTAETDSLEGGLRFQGGDLLSRSGAALAELKPDDFRLRADSPGSRALPDGKDLGADVDLVGPGAAYERWKKMPEYQEWLKESGQVLAEAAQAEPQAFVVLGGAGVAERKFDTLADAVIGSSDGDTIEIRGNGPFVTDPIEFKHTLTVRSPAGFSPVLLAARRDEYPWGNLFLAHSPLRLEGLEVRAPSTAYRILEARRPLWVANCRFVTDGGVCIEGGSACVIRNSEIVSRTGASLVLSCKSQETSVVTNNLLIGQVNLWEFDVVRGATFRFTGNTFFSPFCNVFLHLMSEQQARSTDPLENRVNLFAVGNVISCGSGPYGFVQDDKPRPNLSASDAEAWVRRRVNWQEKDNCYQVKLSEWIQIRSEGVVQTTSHKSLADWNQFWGLKDTGSSENILRFHGGDLIAKALTDATKLSLEDIRLRPDSAGYRAGPDGKDLGADVDLVGPGAAYDRWKETPDHQQWLKEPWDK